MAHLTSFHRAVKSADPAAEVVLGGCPPGVFPAPAESDGERDFFLHVIERGRDVYDVFDIHLYGDPYLIPRTLEDLRAVVGDKPVVVGEYNGPLVLQYPEVFEHLGEVMRAGAFDPWERLTVEDFLHERHPAEPVRAAMRRLYDRMAERGWRWPGSPQDRTCRPWSGTVRPFSRGLSTWRWRSGSF